MAKLNAAAQNPPRRISPYNLSAYGKIRTDSRLLTQESPECFSVHRGWQILSWPDCRNVEAKSAYVSALFPLARQVTTEGFACGEAADNS